MNYFEKGLAIVKRIEDLGFIAYIVGGAVRDYLLKTDVHDIDLTSNIDFETLDNNFKIVKNGERYESYTIIYEDDSFEITHFRCDVSYNDHRHPTIENVDSFYFDSNRRDFTINALAMNSKCEIIDYHNGINDLNNKIVRAIGNPFVRFEEDALRILRALYFVSKLNFSMDNNTLMAIVDKKKLLEFLSEERIYAYFKKIIYSKYHNGIDLIDKYDLFEYIPIFKKWLKVVDNCCNVDDLEIYYYIKYKEYPIKNKNNYDLCLIASELIEYNFNNYVLFKYQNYINRLNSVFNHLGYDIIKINSELSSLKIKSEKELALSTLEISKLFNGKMIKFVINEVIKAILDGRIDNNKVAILTFIEGLDVRIC